MLLEIILGVGLLGAICMFIGDMSLYYTKDDLYSEGSLQPLINVMRKLSRKRLYVGGILGPVAAFLYCIGYFHLVMFMDEKYVIAGWCCFFINCLGIICGGAYHSHYPYYGLVADNEMDEAIQEMRKYMDVQKLITFGLQGIGFLMLAVFIVLGWTGLPRWMVLFSPGILFCLITLVNKLPKGLHIIFLGGWTNWISIIYYLAALVVTIIQ